jgi:hypothetical protein
MTAVSGGSVRAHSDELGDGRRNATAARIAENEAIFRDANEEIEGRARELEFPGRVPFICECGDTSCRLIVNLAHDEYEAVRADPTHFFVVPGHEHVAGPSGSVVRGGDRFVVVEKVGLAGEVAAERDRRTSSD